MEVIRQGHRYKSMRLGSVRGLRGEDLIKACSNGEGMITEDVGFELHFGQNEPKDRLMDNSKPAEVNISYLEPDPSDYEEE